MDFSNKKKGRMNFMSYMIVVKTKNSTIIAADSYSTYPNKELKDANYKKIHKLSKDLCIALNGINEVLKNGKLVDINTTFQNYFQEVTKENLADKVRLYATFLKSTCDKYYQDIRFFVIFKNVLYRVDVIHNQPISIEYLDENQEDYMTSGEDEYLMYGLLHIKPEDLKLSVFNLLDKCILSVEDVIHLDSIRNPEGYRTVGGKVQWMII